MNIEMLENITKHLNQLNIKPRGRGNLIISLYETR